MEEKRIWNKKFKCRYCDNIAEYYVPKWVYQQERQEFLHMTLKVCKKHYEKIKKMKKIWEIHVGTENLLKGDGEDERSNK